jgi:hypothetical protein
MRRSSFLKAMQQIGFVDEEGSDKDNSPGE